MDWNGLEKNCENSGVLTLFPVDRLNAARSFQFNGGEIRDNSTF